MNEIGISDVNKNRKFNMTKEEIKAKIALHQEEIQKIHALEMTHPVTDVTFNDITKLRHQRVINLKKSVKVLRMQLQQLEIHPLVKTLKQIGL